MRVWSLGWEDPLEEGMAIHFSILAWRIPWRGVPGRLHSIRSQRVRHDWSDLHAVTCGCESCTIKKAEHWRIDGFELCWRRLLRVPCAARRSNQSILKEFYPEYSLEGLMLKLQYFDYLMRRANSLEKTLMLGKIEGKRRSGQQRIRWLDSNTNSMDMNFREIMKDREAWHAVVHPVARNRNWLGNWTTTTICFFIS